MEDFIGRTNELITIRSFLSEKQAKDVNVLLVKGDGGVGKSSLLKKLLSEDKKDNVLFYDFDYPLYHSSENIRSCFAQEIGSDSFETYNRSLEELNELKAKQVGVHLIRRAHEDTSQHWNESLLKSTNNKSPEFFFDTIDSLSLIEIEKFIIYFVSYLPIGVSVVIAGRNKQIGFIEELLEKNNHEEVSIKSKTVEVTSFNDAEVDSFIENKLSKSLLFGDPWPEYQWKAPLKKLTRNLPILLDLSLDVLTKPSEQIHSTNNFLSNFGRLLSLLNDGLSTEMIFNDYDKIITVEFLKTNNDFIKQLIILLSHAWPVSYNDIKSLFPDLSSEDVNEFISLADNVSYIKTDTYTSKNQQVLEKSFRLQDVMREMIVKFSLEENILTKSDKKRISNIYLDIVKEKIYDIEINKASKGGAPSNVDLYLQNLKAQEVKHLSYLCPNSGIQLFLDYIDGSNNRYTETSFVNQLFSLVEESIFDNSGLSSFVDYIDEHPSDIKLVSRYLLRKVDFYLHRDLNKSNIYFAELSRILERHSINQDLESEILVGLSSFEIKKGNFRKALMILSEVQNKCLVSGTELTLFNVLTTKGWLFRLMGSYSEACASYAEAYDLVIDNKDSEKGSIFSIKDIATLLQTWSYAIALERNYDQAISLAENARKLFKQIDFLPGVGRVESVLGRIKIERNLHTEAMQHFENAERIISVDNYEWLSKLLVGKAYSLLTMASFSQESQKSNGREISELKQAEMYLTKAKLLDIGSERVELQYLMGLFNLRVSNFDKAGEDFIKSEESAFIEKAFSFVLRSLIGQVRVSISKKLLGLISTESDYYSKTLSEYLEIFDESRCDRLLLYILRKNIADLMFLEEKPLDLIFPIYKENLPKIGELYRHFPNDLIGQLGRTQVIFERYAMSSESNPEEKYDQKKITRVRTLSKQIAEFWRSDKSLIREFPNSYTVVRHWCSGDLGTWNEW